MNQDLTNLLICPACKTRLALSVFPEPTEPAPRAEQARANREIVSGALKCGRCSVVYPVVEGVPRFLRDGLRPFPEFLRQYATELKPLAPPGGWEQHPATAQRENDYDNIRKSFSQEWSIFDYDSDKTWGWTLEERHKVFLGDVCLPPEQLAGKRMLDAGCGNGTLTASLSSFGLDIVGLDLNDGLGRAHANRGKYASEAAKRVQFVQGNLVEPPLRDSAFDLIYSSGVIHHTPSSQQTFASLARMVRPGGRLYVWVYGKRPWPVRLFFWWGRGLKRWMSLKSVMRVCRLLAPPYKGCAELLNALRVMHFRRRTSHEITLDLFDAFAPRFNHWHTEDEVRAWFGEQGFRNVQVSGIQKHGFGMYGDKA